MWDRKSLKEQGKAALKRNYWKAVLVSALFAMILGGTGAYREYASDYAPISPQSGVDASSVDIGVLVIAAMGILLVTAIFVAISILVTVPFEVGACQFRLNAVRGTGNISDLGNGYDISYQRNVKTLFFRNLYVCLWSLLLVVPGIVKAYEYRMIPYLLADHPEMTKEEAFQTSKLMMQGNKWNTFLLDLSFVLWWMLGALTCGIASVLYVHPYVQLTEAALYETLRAQ